ncbi:PP2C family protein-serine/threonine phosphatase [Streptomyces clavuligerus]|uniref:Putative magnesium or manganese-dependent protein phosphatase n=1 Tax=Streptomyces clavuligerus TaxID=1901 RepID=E2Q6Y2_STRCL|nr:SpoIIE family protein phosphatase [Streptomyces clavuligerus]EFG05229.1 Putative magnesium or manganese-dependent protein phosphatase [Streptomyces clavuligerus]MBY6306381.1 SpoIIE family protein phosphatase [Streptomyces clavuligerus]QCS09003.1 PAS domain S-box protein [Streptomyces clavuligerus]QPJ91659.1 SpoIIE family protein phosphatase [Streptomyces clavuligerus]WDN50493.1 SpoIIE family protein phosphatase [Streptomyces clavuligerus]
MPSHVFADPSASQPPERGTVDALISRTRRLRGDVDAVRRDTVLDEDDPHGRWQRALCDLAVHQLDDLGTHLGQLKEGLADPADGSGETGAFGSRGTGSHDGLPDGLHDAFPGGGPADGPAHPGHHPAAMAHPGHPGHPERSAGSAYEDPLAGYEADRAQRTGSLIGRVGSAEWNLLTDEVRWSEELFRILGRSPLSGPMTLDELPSVVFAEDQPLLTALVTGCLVDGRPIDGEFRMVRADGRVRTVHMTGEPVLDSDGSTASMWAVFRDVSELRRSERAVRESRDSLHRRQYAERTERRLAVELQEAVLPFGQGSLPFPDDGSGALDIAAHYFPSGNSALIGGDWYDAFPLPDGGSLLGVGDLTGHGPAATSAMAMLLGAVRGMSLAGVAPGPLLGHLNHLLDTSAQPSLGSVVCCRFDPASRVLSWAQAGHPAPLLFRRGTGRPLTPPEGMLLGAAPGTRYEQAELRLLPGDLLVLHTDALMRTGATVGSGAERLLALAPRFEEARDAQGCLRALVEAFGWENREDDACVLVARVTS